MRLVESLIEREQEVLQFLATGNTNQQIADELVLTEGTIKTYISHIYRKLGVANSTQTIAAARKHGLIR